MSQRLEQRFAACKAEGRAALVTFITAGDPDIAQSRAIVSALASHGADVIELGMPFTDPMADGAAIQAANLRALAGHVKLSEILALVSDFRREDADTPIVLMGYANPILAYGAERFAKDAATAGVDGCIVVDLPPEEDGDLGPALRAQGLHFIRLATPTTDAQRLPKVLQGASGFLYYVSVAGITGTQTANNADIAQAVARIKASTDLPIAVGFGIRTPEQAAEVARHADGVVVGSAIVTLIGEAAAQKANDIAARAGVFVEGLARAVRTARKEMAS